MGYTVGNILAGAHGCGEEYMISHKAWSSWIVTRIWSKLMVMVVEKWNGALQMRYKTMSTIKYIDYTVEHFVIFDWQS